jgi:glycosyltransferase involved in cell wall biosynthesis
VASVFGQTYRPIEIIIVDDGSTDGTSLVADELARNNPAEIMVIHTGNAGPGPAREAGRQAARGEYIQYLDSDDILLPEKFRLQVEVLRNSTECGVSYGKTRYVEHGAGPQDVPWKRTGERIETMFPSFLESRWWGTSTPLYRRKVVEQAGPWSDLKNEEDWEYDCRIAALGTRLQYVPEYVSEERDHGGSRLSRDSSRDDTKLRARALAHELILGIARRAGIGHEVSEMRHYARELFLLSRQCGAAGLKNESQRLFALARQASGPVRGAGWDFRIYRLATVLLGWRWSGRASCLLDRIRK